MALATLLTTAWAETTTEAAAMSTSSGSIAGGMSTVTEGPDETTTGGNGAWMACGQASLLVGALLVSTFRLAHR